MIFSAKITLKSKLLTVWYLYLCERTVLIIVRNDSFKCLRYSFSCVYNKVSEIISVVAYILLNTYLPCCF